MPLRKPHSTDAHYHHELNRSERQILESQVLKPAIKQDQIEARIIHLALWTWDDPQIQVPWGEGERIALGWLADQLKDFRWREHEYPASEFPTGDLKAFQETASKIAADIHFELSGAREDTLADPRERAS